jgi:hypothetical protein
VQIHGEPKAVKVERRPAGRHRRGTAAEQYLTAGGQPYHFRTGKRAP